MKKELIFIRHGKSKEKEAGEKDIDRMLEGSGMREISRLGRYLKLNDIIPDMILFSPALRARQSAELIGDQIEIPPDKLVEHEDLFDASVRVILHIINELADELNRVYVVGHNPGLLYFAEFISGESLGQLPAGGLVRIVFEVNNWASITEKTGRIVGTIFPGEFEV